jgi:hypothetical protein
MILAVSSREEDRSQFVLFISNISGDRQITFVKAD